MSPPFAREALPSPELPVNHNGGTYRIIRIRHPAYPNSAPDLLQLSATDGDDWDGLDFDIARAACSIVTTVGWDDGVFAVQTEASSGAAQAAASTPTCPRLSAVERPADGVLRESLYFWCRRLADGAIDPSVRTDKYPVYASFQHWRFPHSALPEPWRRVALPPYAPASSSVSRVGKQAAVDRDGSCRVSASTDACETAHLIPYSEKNWFVSNQMAQYVRNPMAHLPIDDERNLILLRRDLHFLFDRNRYVFVPMSPPPPQSPSHPESSSPAIAIHVLQPIGSVQLVHTYHNRLTQQRLRGISLEMLFARFAWAVFHDEIMPFFSGQQAFAVRIWDDATGCAKDVTLSAKAIAGLAQIFEPSGTRSRSVSPKKRALSTQDRDTWNESDPDRDDEEDDAEQWTRGRRRFRSPEVTQLSRLSGNATEPPSLDGSFATTASVTSLASQGIVPGESAQNTYPATTRKRSHEEDSGNGEEERWTKRFQEL